MFDVESFKTSIENIAWGAEAKHIPYEAYYWKLLEEEDVTAFFKSKGIDPEILHKSLETEVKKGLVRKRYTGFGAAMMDLHPVGEYEEEKETKISHSQTFEEALNSATENALIAGRSMPNSLDLFAELLNFNGDRGLPRIFKKLNVHVGLFLEEGYGTKPEILNEGACWSSVFNGVAVFDVDGKTAILKALRDPQIRGELKAMLKEALGLSSSPDQSADLAGQSSPEPPANDSGMA